MSELAKLTWLNDVDLGSLPKEAQIEYEAYKAEYKKASERRVKFESIMQAHGRKQGLTKEGQCIVFGYNFGKLSLAIGAERTKAKQGTSSLAALKA